MLENDDRIPPKRVRLSGLQEAQLRALMQLDALCSSMFYELGFDAAEVPQRTEADLAALPRGHNVVVAEADYVPAGLLTWRDESPGVAYLADIEVHPDYQRFGIATQLLETLKEQARAVHPEHHLQQIVVRCWEKASWAMAFYRRYGFAPIDASSPPKVQGWRAERTDGGRPLTRPGEVALWAEIGPAPKLPEEPEEDEGVPPGEPDF
jgi:GNAT superfamily N-acetyltransferase